MNTHIKIVWELSYFKRGEAIWQKDSMLLNRHTYCQLIARVVITAQFFCSFHVPEQ